ncbi:hypothetical protein HDU96_009500 [Phlyctochytrium bullatum]|nr:hypothetical protein HDU96_009500 [Phlyctochytrium bullatum]
MTTASAAVVVPIKEDEDQTAASLVNNNSSDNMVARGSPSDDTASSSSDSKNTAAGNAPPPSYDDAKKLPPPQPEQPQEAADEHRAAGIVVEDAGLCPEDTASFLSRITFHWLNPIFVKGWKNPLGPKDMWRLGTRYQAETLISRFDKYWAKELERLPAPAPAAEAKPAPAEAEAEKSHASTAVEVTVVEGTSDEKKLPLGDADVVNTTGAKLEAGKVEVIVDTAQPANKTGAAPAAKDAKKKKDSTFNPEGPSLLRALYTMFWNEVAPIGIIKFMADMCSVFSPLFVKYIIVYVQAKGALGEGFGLILGMFALQILGTFLLNNFFHLAVVAGMKIRATLSASIYRKTLRLSAAARHNFNSGKVINLVATDTNRIEMFITFIHIIWTAPIQILIIIAFLCSQLGWAALVGVSILFLSMPLQGVVMKRLAQIRKDVAPITDQRVKLTTEVLTGIRVIKFFAWEVPFLNNIEDLRKKEIVLVFRRSILQAFAMTLAFGIPILAAAIAFVIYGATNSLDASRIFSSLSWFTNLRFPLMFLPNIITGWADFKVAINRIQEMLLAPELEEQPAIDASAPHALQIVDGEFTWEAPPPAPAAAGGKPGKPGKPGKDEKKGKKKGKNDAKTSGEANRGSTESDDQKPKGPLRSTLRNLNLTVQRGELVAVVGTVGSGKSSLLNAIVGEMKKVKGSLSFSGTMGYAPQSAWIQNATLEQNITFGLPFDEAKYKKAIKDCALETDLKVLPDGDQTSIGERGINLSGGQKQRVNLARCVYYDPDIILLDDPLSAVDAHVGKYLFDKCIMGALAGKTRILVTHQLHFLSRVDRVLVFRDGEIVEQGTYPELMAAEGEFATLIKNYGAEEDDEPSPTPKPAEVAARKKSEPSAIEEKKMLAAKDAEPEKKKSGNIMKEEDRATGTVSGKVWWSYVVASGGWGFIAGLLATLVFLQSTRIGNDLWLVWWSGNRFAGTFNLSGYIAVYCVWGLSQTLATYLFGLFFAFSGTRAARTLHEAAAARIVRAPTLFFDTTPLGRIINRFSKDQDGIDNTLSDSYRMFTNTLATSLSTFVLICYATPLFAVPLAPLLGVYYFMQLIYRATSRELKRLDSVSRSPLYANFGETLTGLPTIRAYREQNRFISNNDRATDGNNSPYFLLVSSQRWLGLRLEILGGVLVFFAGLFGIIARSTIDPALLGLSLSYALQVTQILNWCIRQFTETEVAMNAVERVEHYGFRIDVEADAVIPHNRPPKEWPVNGEIEFKNVEMKYAPELPLVLKGVSFAIKDGQKIGVVGRTGSGKSSLMQALFRMVEPSSGEIVIDGVSSQTIGLRDLRSKLAIIPQDPVLFSGTFRTNLDPFNEYADADLWDALARSGLKSKVAEEGAGGLEGRVTDGGENLSVGQRQLLCLARAMLRKPKVLIMDEATANVDYETDALIQKALREDFAHATVLTIAHRLNTIIDYDRVLVMDAGQISEYDSPANLLDRADSKFRAMVAETGASNFEMLKAIAHGQGQSSSAAAVEVEEAKKDEN